MIPVPIPQYPADSVYIGGDVVQDVVMVTIAHYIYIVPTTYIYMTILTDRNRAKHHWAGNFIFTPTAPL